MRIIDAGSVTAAAVGLKAGSNLLKIGSGPLAPVSEWLKVDAGLLMIRPEEIHIPPELLNVTSELFSTDSGSLIADPEALRAFRGVLAGDSRVSAAVAGALEIDPGVLEVGAAWLIGGWSSLWEGLTPLQIDGDLTVSGG